MEELDVVLLKASRNKAAGVDDIPTEAWQWLTADNRKKLLDILNQALTAGHIPQEWQKALVVEFYKGKGSTADPNNYRPISLLSTAYKLMARILQQRLEKAIDHRLRDIQFGFRAGRSTSQPVHVLRRLLEKAERTDDSLYVLLLDWRQAFDKINIEALGSPRGCHAENGGTTVHGVFYFSHLFLSAVSSQIGRPYKRYFRSGIRYQTRLSSFTVPLPHRAQHGLLRRGPSAHSGGVFSQQRHFYDLAYADDTALVARTAERAQQLLGVVETTAVHSNLTLNWDKCLLLKSPASKNHVYNATGGMVNFTPRPCGRCTEYQPHSTPRSWSPPSPPPPTSNSESKLHSHHSHTTSTRHSLSCLVTS